MSKTFRKGVAAAIRQSKSRATAAEDAEWVMLPECGVEVQLRRPPLQMWAATGKFPQRLLGIAMDSLEAKGDLEQAKADTKEKMQDASGREKLLMLKFMADVVRYAFIQPRLVEGATGEDELDPGDLSGDDFLFAFQWATRTLEGQKVGANGMTVGAVETFRQGGQDQPASDAGGDVPQLPNAAAG